MEIAIIFGGVSYEHEISIVSAISLKKVINFKKKYIFCDKNHQLYLISEHNMKANHFSGGAYKKDEKIYLKRGGFFTKTIFGEKKVEFDAVLNVIHGGDGEDGTMAGLFDFFHIPYIGPRKEASVASYNKIWTKYFADFAGVKTLPYETVSKRRPHIGTSFPFIIKPVRLGSSIGVSVVKDEGELSYALDVAFEFDSALIIEPYIEDIKEYNLAGCKVADEFIYSIIEEPQKSGILDFDKKYKDFSRTKQVVEADLPEAISQKFYDAFNKIYDPLFLGALIRCDFFMIDGEVYLNEINPNPGSLANYLFKDFNKTLEVLAKNLPKQRNIPINYDYIHSINSAKGKV